MRNYLSREAQAVFFVYSESNRHQISLYFRHFPEQADHRIVAGEGKLNRGEKGRVGGQETIPGSWASRHFLLRAPVAQCRPQVHRQADGECQPNRTGEAKCHSTKGLPDAREMCQEWGQEQ
jgi:hypothetical protein